jgi:hypothetical protein
MPALHIANAATRLEEAQRVLQFAGSVRAMELYRGEAAFNIMDYAEACVNHGQASSDHYGISTIDVVLNGREASQF